jgi:hypothetical protein
MNQERQMEQSVMKVKVLVFQRKHGGGLEGQKEN